MPRTSASPFNDFKRTAAATAYSFQPHPVNIKEFTYRIPFKMRIVYHVLNIDAHLLTISFFSITRKPLISLSIRSFHNFLYDTTTVSTFLG